MTELERWNHFKASVLVPSIKNNNWYPINSSIQLVQYIPTMEKLFSNAVNSYKMKSYQQAWSKFMKVATYIMEELRQHPQWKTLSSDLKGRLMNVLAKRSISYAEVSEAHMRAEFIQDVRRKDTEERERNQRIKRDIVAAACKEEKQTASKKEGEITFRTAITMFVNGEKVNVPTDINPHMRLVDFLRNLGKTGTKIGCGEGGCGACSVLMSFNNGTPETIPTHRVINSCLRSIASCDGAYITTVEGIGASGRNKKMHPVQERLAQCNGSQCGYCSPGWVMNAYSMLMNNPTPSSKQVVQDRFDGNLCRCTGMRSILQAFSSFVPSDDGDKKDKGDYSKTCCSSSDNKSKASQTLATYDPQSQIQLANKLLPSVLSRENMMLPLKLSCTNISNTKKEQEKETTVPTWYAPTSLSNFNSILTEVIEAKQTYQLELGGTSRGVTKYYNGQVDGTSSGDVEPDVYISIFRVEELNAIATDSNNNLIFGASVTLSEVIVALRKSTGDPMHQQLANHLSRVANLQVRNVGGWAGNLMLAKMYPTFPSDILTTMSAAGAILTFQRWTISEADENDNDCDDTTVLQQPKVEHLSVPSWAYESPSTDYKDVLLNISIPPSTAPSTTVPRTVFTSYKLARRQQNSHALVNFACRLLLDPADDKTVLSATIYLHGNDNQRLTHAVSTCNALIGQDITSQSTLISALNALETTDLKNRAPFVISASSSLLYKTILTAQPNEISPALVTATNWQVRVNHSYILLFF
jgi:xanthine dehydrogenase/oxidase